ncbi:MAG: type II secretion system protein [Alphaproteobacteria bacterium]|nr:type II secretion system protein [Alphaproteobacteria bacterium]
MQTINQSGRSMIEMLGVLAIIGVLTAGGLTIVGKARHQQELTQLLSETAEIVSSIKKMACDYDDGYASYVNMLCQSNGQPNGTTCTISGKDSYITTSSDAKVKAIPDPATLTTEGVNYFDVEISEISKDACVYLASSDWGRRNTNGFLGAYSDASGKPSSASPNDEPIDPVLALSYCAEEDGVIKKPLHLLFLACQKN